MCNFMYNNIQNRTWNNFHFFPSSGTCSHFVMLQIFTCEKCPLIQCSVYVKVHMLSFDVIKNYQYQHLKQVFAKTTSLAIVVTYDKNQTGFSSLLKAKRWPKVDNVCVILVSCRELTHWQSYHIFLFVYIIFK